MKKIFKLSYFIPRMTFWCCVVLCITSSSTWKYVKANKALWFQLNPRFLNEKGRIQGLFPSSPAKSFDMMLRWAERGCIFLSCHNLNLFSWASWALMLLSLLCIHSSWGSYIWTSPYFSLFLLSRRTVARSQKQCWNDMKVFHTWMRRNGLGKNLP